MISAETEEEKKIFERLKKSKFRSSFSLKEKDLEYIQQKGFSVILKHAYDFIEKRLAPAIITNDGKQTPMKGHPVFIAQHATATCCRGCLYKWYKIPPNTELTKKQQENIVRIIMIWISQQIEKNNNEY